MIDDSDVFVTIGGADGKPFEYCNEELALSVLLSDGPLMVSYEHYEEKTEICVVCSDVFAWACADAEPLPVSEIGPFFRLWREQPKWSAAIWSCFRRRMQPQPPVKRDMIKDGVWTEELERLPENPSKP